MNFRLTFASENPFTITHQHKILTLGSCFSEEIASKLSDYKFKVLKNPFGILFHPLAIRNALDKAIKNEKFVEQDVNIFNELYFIWDIHSKFNELSEEDLLKNSNQTISEFHSFLKETDVIFITLGTSFIYELIENRKIVANCHKVPANKFQKKLLSENEIKQALQSIIYELQKFNSKIKIVFTVSPVRHTKDGIFENNVSKGRLLSAVYSILATNNVFYFPSYELIIDDLRDYRFYKKDLIHPNELAVDYVWEKFSETYFSTTTQELNLKIEKLNKSYQHQSKHIYSEEYQKLIKFRKNLEFEINKMINLNNGI
jgi:hypothetical protein